MESERGRVTLTGKVRIADEEARAASSAKIDGVTTIVNEFEIYPNVTESTTDRTAAKMKEGWNKAVDAAAKGAEKAKERARKDVSESAKALGKGADKTTEAVGTAGDKVSDASLTTRVKGAFVDEPVLRDSSINVDTSARIVTFRGTALSAAAKAKAEDIAKRTRASRASSTRWSSRRSARQAGARLPGAGLRSWSTIDDVRHRDAVDLLAPAALDASFPSTWVDLGAGAGAFTLALADLLGSRSVIHALDRDRAALSQIPNHASVRIESHVADFEADPWPVAFADGILMANSLHYVAAQRPFLESCAVRLSPSGAFLVVEYDTDASNPWVPHPASRQRLQTLFRGLGVVTVLGSRPSAYRRASLYAAVAKRGIIGSVGA